MRDLSTLYQLYQERRAVESARHGRWREVAQVYDGELVVPRIETDEIAASAVPNLVSQGINFYARTYASTVPDCDSPALKPHIARSRRLAQDRVRAIKGWWEASGLAVAEYQRGMFYFGYGAMPAVIRGHPGMSGVPRWEVRNPHCVLPGPKDLDYLPAVPDAFIVVRRSAKWVSANFGVDFGSKVRPDTMMELVEYDDPEQKTLFCVGPAGDDMPTWTHGINPAWSAAWGGRPYGQEIINRRIVRLSGPTGEGGKPWLLLLSSTPNYAGMCTVSYPGAISLSKTAGLVDGILAKHHLQAKIMDLWIKGITKGIFPNEWIITNPNEGGRVVTMADGMKGIVGEIEAGSVVLNQLNPGYQTGTFVDRLETYQRGESGISPEFGGESGQNIRTGRRGEQVQSTVVDPVVEQAHKIAQIAREHENRIAVAWSKGYAGSRQVSFYVSKGRTKEQVSYVPNEVFETDETTVRYPIAGVDASGLAIRTIQQSGAGVLSQHDVRVLSPDVEDVDATEAQIRVEALEQGALAALNQLLLAAPQEYATALRMAAQGESVADIYEAVQRSIQERQATSGAPGEPTGPVEPGTPEAMPGMGAPGIADAGTTGAAPAGIRDIAMLFQNSRAPSRTVPAERVAG